jgi:hypothetical protein
MKNDYPSRPISMARQIARLRARSVCFDRAGSWQLAEADRTGASYWLIQLVREIGARDTARLLIGM